MPTRARLEHEAFAAQARLLACELEIEGWLRLRASQQQAARRLRPSAADGEDLLDRSWASFVLANPRHYPAYRGMPVDTVTRIVRRQRLDTVHVRGGCPQSVLNQSSA
jgi:hypothetical protein